MNQPRAATVSSRRHCLSSTLVLLLGSLVLLKQIDLATSSSASSSSRGITQHQRWWSSSVPLLKESSHRTTRTVSSSAAALSLLLRGGSTKVTTTATTTATATTDPDLVQQLHAYRLQQQLYLSSRSLQLRQALIQRGVSELAHTVKDTSQQISVADWDCAVSTDDHPKSCLYSLDAAVDSKVVAPVGTDNWITLTALNRLRRNDPTKVEPLWHSQYHVMSTWFNAAHEYSLYTHLSAPGTVLACLLDQPVMLTAVLVVTLLMALLITLPVWESLLQLFLTNPLIWQYWPTWGRFVHAALPLKLLLGQMAVKFIQSAFLSLHDSIRGTLVEWECRCLEDCTPVTLLERGNNDDDDDYEQVVLAAADESSSSDDDSDEDDE